MLDPSLFPLVIQLQSGCAQVSSVPHLPLIGWILPTGSSEPEGTNSCLGAHPFLSLSTSQASGLSGPEENVLLQQPFQARARKVL